MKKPYVKPGLMRLDATKPVKNQVGSETDSVGAVAQATNRRRSERVILRVAIVVHAAMPDGKRAQVRAFTLVVNAHGGLLESALPAVANQRLTLVNPQTGKKVGCRVVRVERASSESIRVAFEFHEPNAQFWPISFPPEDWEEVAP